MSLLKCLLFLTFCFTVTGAHSIQKRSLGTLGSMIQAVTNRSAFDFNSYGKWCGLAGSGIPVDSIDRCCMHHDLCYKYVNIHQCKYWHKTDPYLVKYKWYYNGKEAICNDQRICHQSTCLCDKNAISCFRDHLSDYNKDNQSIIRKIVDGIIG